MAFLRRLGILIGAVFFWFMCALALPELWTLFAVAILTACIVSMKKAGQMHPPGKLFGGFAIATLVVSLFSWFVVGDVSSDYDPEQDADYEAEREVDGEENEEVARQEAREPDPEPKGEPTGDGAAADAPDPGSDRLAQVEQGIAAAKALKKQRCANIDAVAEAWSLLSVAKKGDKNFGKAKKMANKVERCRKKARAKLPKAQRRAMLVEKGLDKPLKLR